MSRLKKETTREIIEDFQKEIAARKMETVKPSKTVINFRTDMEDGIERTVYRVPTNILRYRKDNGRIASDIMDYEKNNCWLDENDQQTQEIIKEFLAEKDVEMTKVLKNSIKKSDQREPAIITCDGFLINGNRRKMVLEQLQDEFPGTDHFNYMKVVILPRDDEEGGPPTLLEIEKIENRYQLQRGGKSEYYGFDRALSIKRKIEMGLSLEDQLRDDPQHAHKRKKEFKKALKNYKKEYLEPLKCIDRYLAQFNSEDMYRKVSKGRSDSEGRWQAFKDYSATYNKKFHNPKNRIKLGIDEIEIGDIEEASFDMIRLRHIPDMPKIHTIMRNLPKYIRTKEGKKNIVKIAEEVKPVLPENEHFDDDGEPLPTSAIDAKWAAKNKQAIIHRLKRARDSHETKEGKETPLKLLEAAYKKLEHKDMDLTAIAISDYREASSLSKKIKNRADEIETEIYHLEKDYKKLGKENG